MEEENQSKSRSIFATPQNSFEDSTISSDTTMLPTPYTPIHFASSNTTQPNTMHLTNPQQQQLNTQINTQRQIVQQPTNHQQQQNPHVNSNVDLQQTVQVQPNQQQQTIQHHTTPPIQQNTVQQNAPAQQQQQQYQHVPLQQASFQNPSYIQPTQPVIKTNMPLLQKNNIEGWFLALDFWFRANNIISDEQKYLNVMTSLEPSVLQQVVLKCTTMPPNNQYNFVRGIIIQHYTDSKKSRLNKVLNEMPLGDLKPSQL